MNKKKFLLDTNLKSKFVLEISSDFFGLHFEMSGIANDQWSFRFSLWWFWHLNWVVDECLNHYDDFVVTVRISFDNSRLIFLVILGNKCPTGRETVIFAFTFDIAKFNVNIATFYINRLDKDVYSSIRETFKIVTNGF